MRTRTGRDRAFWADCKPESISGLQLGKGLCDETVGNGFIRDGIGRERQDGGSGQKASAESRRQKAEAVRRKQEAVGRKQEAASRRH
jgi:hypothetical protein